MYRRRPHDIPRVYAVLVLGLLFSIWVLLLLVLTAFDTSVQFPPWSVLLAFLTLHAFVAHRYRASRRTYLLQSRELPATNLWHVVLFLFVPLALFMAWRLYVTST
ncbi:hypothetical protein GCM10023186_09270 [Hymenobacter koreensis]|uniref:Transmembrane protein n=1 Tax=Hymenobacter koreensis TaxID=1084523 RepID=A0ABP8IVQ0_9BACT